MYPSATAKPNSPSPRGVNTNILLTTKAYTCLRDRYNLREPKHQKQNIRRCEKTSSNGVII